MKETYVLQQLWQMLQMFVVGWIMMLSAQEKQVLSKLARWRDQKNMVADFVFCFLWAILLWLILLSVSGGLVRNYIILGWLGGAIGYQVLFRKPLEPICRFVAKGMIWSWHWFWCVMLAPYRFVYRRFLVPSLEIIRKITEREQEFDVENEKI